MCQTRKESVNSRHTECEDGDREAFDLCEDGAGATESGTGSDDVVNQENMLGLKFFGFEKGENAFGVGFPMFNSLESLGWVIDDSDEMTGIDGYSGDETYTFRDEFRLVVEALAEPLLPR